MRRFLAVVVVSVFILLVVAPIARSGDNVEGLPVGLGHPSDHTSYFDGNCCNKNDCEMIPDTAITETADGWKVRYWTNNWGGRIVEGFVKRGSEKMSKRCSPDGLCNGICTYFSSERVPAHVRCLYIMPSA